MAPLLRGWRPLREILDPPLLLTDFRNLFFFFFLKSGIININKNLRHFVKLKISYGQVTRGLKTAVKNSVTAFALQANVFRRAFVTLGSFFLRTVTVLPDWALNHKLGYFLTRVALFFLRVALSHKLGYFSVLGELRLAKYYGDPKKTSILHFRL